MEHKYFSTIFKLYDFLLPSAPGLDVNASLSLPRYWFSDGQTEFKNSNIREFCTTFNARFGTNMCEVHSFNNRKRFTIFFKPPVVEVDDTEVDDTPVVKDTVEAPLCIDWAFVDTLENTKEGKTALKDYAAKFDISLKGNKTLKTFVEEFKAASESK